MVIVRPANAATGLMRIRGAMSWAKQDSEMA
jgi:hypothetical protein